MDNGNTEEIDKKAQKLSLREKTDLELVEMIVREEHEVDEAFDEIYHRYKNLVFKTIFYSVRDRTDCEDIFQNTFLQVYRSLKSFRRNAEFRTWLMAVCNNLIKTHHRQNFRKGRLIERYGRESPSEFTPDYAEEIHQDAMMAKLREEINKLPEEFRTAYVLRTVQDFSPVETARALKISERMVRKRVEKAEKILREKMKETGSV
jgi:RNA polymerase sigma-70 factor (ECF subfamily)